MRHKFQRYWALTILFWPVIFWTCGPPPNTNIIQFGQSFEEDTVQIYSPELGLLKEKVLTTNWSVGKVIWSYKYVTKVDDRLVVRVNGCEGFIPILAGENQIFLVKFFEDSISVYKRQPGVQYFSPM